MIKNKFISKKLILLSIPVVLIGLLIWNFNIRDRASSISENDGINYGPPSEEEKSQADENKKRIDQREEQIKSQPAHQTGTKKSVKPIITYAGQYEQAIEVGAYITGIFEDGGTCTATFTMNTRTITKSVQAVKNANSVDCPVMTIPINEFTQKGVWAVIVDYNSGAANGVSDPRQVEVK